MTPTVGRIVHWYAEGPDGPVGPHAACITHVVAAESGVVELAVFHPNGFQWANAVSYHPEPKAGRWTWPPRVAPKQST